MAIGAIILKILGFLAFLVLTQDAYIFPGAFVSKIKLLRWRNKGAPKPVTSCFIEATDGTSLEVWKYPSEQTTRLSEFVAIVFHGNGAPLENFIFVQMWLAELGVQSYSFDYRGFGLSSGWPSEKGIALDSDAVWDYVLEQEGIDPEKILIVGISVGSAPASRIAAKHSPRLLLLVSAFTDLKSAVRAQPLIGFLWPFVRYRFSTIDQVKLLSKTDLLLAHGRNDKVVPCDHSRKLEAAYGGCGRSRRLVSEAGGHNLAFFELREELGKTLNEWL